MNVIIFNHRKVVWESMMVCTMMDRKKNEEEECWEGNKWGLNRRMCVLRREGETRVCCCRRVEQRWGWEWWSVVERVGEKEREEESKFFLLLLLRFFSSVIVYTVQFSYARDCTFFLSHEIHRMMFSSTKKTRTSNDRKMFLTDVIPYSKSEGAYVNRSTRQWTSARASI